MAKIKYVSPAPGLEGDFAIRSALNDGVIVNAQATGFSVIESSGNRVEVKGSFTLSNGVVVGGTVTGFDGFIGNTKVAVGSDYALSFAQFAATMGQSNFDNLQAVIFHDAKQVGSQFNDFIDGHQLLGKGGDDFLFGTETADRLKGGDGDDLLFGNGGNDIMRGNDGGDTFVFFAFAPNGVAKIKDFDVGEDHIAFQGDAYELALGPGLVDKGEFGTGPVAEGTETLFYNRKTGGLFFDQDSTGAGAAVQIAELDPHLHLKAKHFLVGDFT